MKKIKFIRHSKLEYPYDDYSKLSFEQISGLATGNIAPGIHVNSKKLLLEKFKRTEIKALDFVFCSPTIRARQTAELINMVKGGILKIMENDNLSEILFDPEILVTREAFEHQGLGIIRESLFSGMKVGIGAEKIEHVLNRIKKLKIDLEQLPYNNILCITHSFYMRLLRLVLIEGGDSTITKTRFVKSIDHGYLEGFEIYI